MLASAPTYFGVESGAFDTYLPDDEAFDGLDAPIQLLVSDASFPAFSQAARWLAERLDAGVTRTPGTHFAYLDHPDELAETLKPFLRNLDPPGANCG
jgi:pimeloyl-ACP methyl ester carboxylesterase